MRDIYARFQHTVLDADKHLLYDAGDIIYDD